MGRLLVFLVVAGVVAYPVFAKTRERALASPADRSRLIVKGLIGVAVGALLALWLPHRVPETSGSPASLVAILCLWIVGGTLAVMSGVVLVAAFLARS